MGDRIVVGALVHVAQEIGDGLGGDVLQQDDIDVALRGVESHRRVLCQRRCSGEQRGDKEFGCGQAKLYRPRGPLSCLDAWIDGEVYGFFAIVK